MSKQTISGNVAPRPYFRKHTVPNSPVKPGFNRLAIRGLAMVAVMTMVVSTFVPSLVPAKADLGSPYGTEVMKKIVLCHWDASNKPNPAYKSSGDVAVSSAISGHGGHVQDIIPPFFYADGKTTAFYPGLNWNEANQDIWDSNGTANSNDPTSYCLGDGILPQPSHLTLVKVVSGGDADATDWTLSATGPATISGATGDASVTNATVTAGVYTLAESTGPANYKASNWSCVNGQSNLNVSNNQVTIGESQNVTCTITNTFKQIDLAINKTVNDSTPDVGQNISYTLSVTNNGPDDASGVVVTDAIPSTLTYVSNTGGSAVNVVSGNVTWTIGNLANGATSNLTIIATVNSGTEGTTITNTGVVTGNEHDSNLDNNSDSEDVTVNTPVAEPSIDVGIAKTTDTPTVHPSDAVHFTLAVTNSGPDDASGVVVNDVLPTGFVFVSATPSGGSTYNSTTGVWDIGTVTTSDSFTLDVQATADGSVLGDITNVAVVTANESDSNQDNNISSATVNVNGDLDVAVTKTASDLTPDVDQTFTYTIVVTNNGPSTANNVSMTDDIPDGIIYQSDDGGADATYSNGTLTWNVGTMTNGASKTLVVTVKVDSGTEGQSITNTAVVPVDANDTNSDNNTDSSTIRVNSPVPTYSLSGKVYNDNNSENGEYDPATEESGTGEAGLAGWTVNLYTKGDPNVLVHSTETDANGDYSFSGLPADCYIVSEVLQSGWNETDPTVADDSAQGVVTDGQYQVALGGASCATQVSFLNFFIHTAQAVAIQTDVTDLNFGNVQIPSGCTSTCGGGGGGGGTPASGSISGTTYIDNNSNGTFDSGDTVLPGVVVFIDANGNGVLDAGESNTTTNSSGTFQFTGLGAGTYSVREVPPTGYTVTQPTPDTKYTVVLNNNTVANRNFGHIAGRVLGDVTTTPSNPQVAGASTQLPRTGMPVAWLLIVGAVAVAAVFGRKTAIAKK